jgi:hypothetical protein
VDGNIQGTFREPSGNIQGTFSEHSVNIQGTFKVADFGLSRSISPERTMTGGLGTFQWMVTFREHSGNLQGTFREHSVNIQ